MTDTRLAERQTSAPALGDPNFVILYVQNAAASAAFYAGLLGRGPVQSSQTFAAFALQSGMMFGVWSRDDVQPRVDSIGSTSEICLPVAGSDAVDATLTDWKRRGLKIAQQPTDMGFGRTFVALDPDGHRLRVFAPRD